MSVIPQASVEVMNIDYTCHQFNVYMLCHLDTSLALCYEGIAVLSIRSREHSVKLYILLEAGIC